MIFFLFLDEDGKEFRENTSDLVYLLRSNNEVHYILLLFRSKDSFLDLAAAAHVETTRHAGEDERRPLLPT